MNRQRKMKKLVFELAEADYYEQTGKLPNKNQLKRFIGNAYSVENIKYDFMNKTII